MEEKIYCASCRQEFIKEAASETLFCPLCSKVGKRLKEQGLIFCFPLNGNYQYMLPLLDLVIIKWVPWHYHFDNIHPDVLKELDMGKSIQGRKIIFCSESYGLANKFRNGYIKTCTRTKDCLLFTVGLTETFYLDEDKTFEIPKEQDKKYLCFLNPL